MVDFSELEALADNNADVRNLVQSVSGQKIVQGTTLRPHPWWSRAMQWQEHRERYGLRRELLTEEPWEQHLLLAPLVEPAGETIRHLDEQPQNWDTWLSIFTIEERKRIKRLPVFVTVHTEPAPSSSELTELLSIVADSLIPAGIERRPIAQLQLSAGDHIHLGSAFGTAGGFLHDPSTGKYFAVSCSHVLGTAGATVTDAVGSSLGQCVDVTRLTPNSGGFACDPVTPASGLTLNTEDAGLVELNRAPAATGLNAPSALRHGQTVDLVLSTGAARFQIRSLAMSMQLRHSGNRYCYRSLVELYSSSTSTKSGDSGAWGEVAGSSGMEWGVMAIGGDGISTFAVRGNDVLSWCQTKVSGAQIY
jgi:hypothetical protein